MTRFIPTSITIGIKPVAETLATLRAHLDTLDPFALAALLSAALSVHLITLLKDAGLTARDAVLASALIGPMQVAGRIAEFFFMRRLSPVAVGTLAFVLMVAGMVCLMLVSQLAPVAVVFAVVYGWSNGVMTIVRGTVPAVLFGRRGYGALLGRLALPSFVAKAAAPLALAQSGARGRTAARPPVTP